MHVRTALVMAVLAATALGCARDALAPLVESESVGDHPADLALAAENRNLCSIIV